MYMFAAFNTRVSSQVRVHNGALVVSMQGNIRAWTRNLKKKSILIHLISLLEWAKGVTFIYLFIYLFNYWYNPAKSSFLHWIILFLALGHSEFTHLWVQPVSAWFNCPINFGSSRTSSFVGFGLVQIFTDCTFLHKPWWQVHIPHHSCNLHRQGYPGNEVNWYINC